MPWSGCCQTFCAQSACCSTIGQRRRGRRSLRRVCSRIESSTAPNTSFWRWFERAVPDPHRARARVAGQVVPRRLGEVPTPVDPVHDLQRPVLGRLDVGDELHELVRLPIELQQVERVERERGVADPRVAVVPVALAARRLRERGRERGDRRAGRHVREALDRQARSVRSPVTPRVIDRSRAVQPVAPEADGGVDALGRLVGVRRDRPGPRPTRARRTAAHPRSDVCRARARPPSMPERHVRREPDRRRRAGRVGRVTTVIRPASTRPTSRP